MPLRLGVGWGSRSLNKLMESVAPNLWFNGRVWKFTWCSWLSAPRPAGRVKLAGGDLVKMLLENCLYITSRNLPGGLNRGFFALLCFKDQQICKLMNVII